MKKISLILILSLLLIGCSSNTTQETETNTNESNEETIADTNSKEETNAEETNSDINTEETSTEEVISNETVEETNGEDNMESTKILFINASQNRDGNTANMAKDLLEGIDYKQINIIDYNIGFLGQEIENDQFSDFISEIEQAETIIIGTPVYWHSMSGAVKTDKRFKAVATISAFNSGRVRRNGFLDNQIDSIQERLEDSANAREKLATTGEIEYIGEYYNERINFTKEELEQIPAGLYREGALYYRDKYYHPNSQSAYTKESLINLMAFDSEDRVELINQPLLMIAGKDADTRYMTDAIFEKAINAKEKELYLIEGASRIETYWKEPYVTQEKEKLIEFFDKYLK